MEISSPRKTDLGYVVDIYDSTGDIYFTADPLDTESLAKDWSENWCSWANRVSTGTVDSIYYIVQVPDTWAGPIGDEHPYSGLFVKIGRSKNVLQRLSNLQTGTFGQLIINALEPGGSIRERELHQQFDAERRQGEWFSCTQELFQHIYRTWSRYKMLPPAHQQKVLDLAQRTSIYRSVRKVLGTPDLVNPSLSDNWKGNIFIDLVYSSLAKSKF